MLDELLPKRAIVPLPENAYDFLSRAFLIPKRTGGSRLILDVLIEGDQKFLASQESARRLCYAVCPFGLSPARRSSGKLRHP